MAMGYWLQYVKPLVTQLRYPPLQFASAIPGDSEVMPRGRIASQLYDYKWVTVESIHNAKGQMVVASKVDYVRPSDGKIVTNVGTEVDLSQRAWVTVRVAGQDHHVLQHAGVAVAARVGQNPIVEVL